MDIPTLQIGRWEFRLPLILGGMGVKISGWQLVLAMLSEDCLGTLTSMGLGDLSQGMNGNQFIESSREALKAEIKILRSHTGKPFAVNIMGALSNADDLIRTAVSDGANIIVYGAGIPRTLPTVVPDPDVALVPVISSARLAQLILKQWKRYNRVPDAFIIEGPLAGGHLGFSFDQLNHMEDFSLEKILKETLEIIQPYEDAVGRKIPLLTAGGIYTGNDIARMLSLGASGVQMGTRFVATTECPVSQEFKQAYIQATADDITIITTPVGMPGRVIRNKFLTNLERGHIPKPSCPFHCIHSCGRDKAGFCIAERLANSFQGNVDEGLIFCGANVPHIDRIMPVRELVTELMDGVKASNLKQKGTL
ncbi:MAG: nitronate monooxygenase family protein [Patescibacteria group bacterium]